MSIRYQRTLTLKIGSKTESRKCHSGEGATMATRVSARRYTLHRTLVGLMVASAVIMLSAIAVPSFGGPKSDTPWLGPVPKAHCGPGDHTESGLQGQTTVRERFSGDSE